MYLLNASSCSVIWLNLKKNKFMTKNKSNVNFFYTCRIKITAIKICIRLVIRKKEKKTITLLVYKLIVIY